MIIFRKLHAYAARVIANVLGPILMGQCWVVLRAWHDDMMDDKERRAREKRRQQLEKAREERCQAPPPTEPAPNPLATLT